MPFHFFQPSAYWNSLRHKKLLGRGWLISAIVTEINQLGASTLAMLGAHQFFLLTGFVLDDVTGDGAGGDREG